VFTELAGFAKFCQVFCDREMGTMNVSLPDSLRSFVDEQVSNRGFGTSSEYVRELAGAAVLAVDALSLPRLLLRAGRLHRRMAGASRATRHTRFVSLMKKDGVTADR
jgi:Arc/MetJ-type ribon-helix-helix transcriptional regulator